MRAQARASPAQWYAPRHLRYFAVRAVARAARERWRKEQPSKSAFGRKGSALPQAPAGRRAPRCCAGRCNGTRRRCNERGGALLCAKQAGLACGLTPQCVQNAAPSAAMRGSVSLAERLEAGARGVAPDAGALPRLCLPPLLLLRSRLRLSQMKTRRAAPPSARFRRRCRTSSDA